MVTKAEAQVLVEAAVNEPDLDWPTKPEHRVFDELTEETDDGWLFFCAVVDSLRVVGRDPEPGEAPPWHVNRETGEVTIART